MDLPAPTLTERVPGWLPSSPCVSCPAWTTCASTSPSSPQCPIWTDTATSPNTPTPRVFPDCWCTGSTHQPLYFANAAYFTNRLQTLVAAADPKPQRVVFNAEAVTYIDALHTILGDLHAQGIVFAVARAEAHFRRVFTTGGYAAELGEGRLCHSVRAAVDAYQETEQS